VKKLTLSGIPLKYGKLRYPSIVVQLEQTCRDIHLDYYNNVENEQPYTIVT